MYLPASIPPLQLVLGISIHRDRRYAATAYYRRTITPEEKEKTTKYGREQKRVEMNRKIFPTTITEPPLHTVVIFFVVAVVVIVLVVSMVMVAVMVVVVSMLVVVDWALQPLR